MFSYGMAITEAEPQVNLYLDDEHRRDLIADTVALILDPTFQADYVSVEARRFEGILRDAQHAADAPRNHPERSPQRAEVARQRVIRAQADLTRAVSLATNAVVYLVEELTGNETLDGELDVDEIDVQPTNSATVPDLPYENEEFFSHAMLWGRSADQHGDYGPQGIGWSSAVIKCFAYWAAERKRGRFKNHSAFEDGAPSLNHFYYLSHDLSGRLMRAEDEPSDRRTVVMQDQHGNTKLYLLGHRHDLTIGFKHHLDDEIRIATFFTGVKDDYVKRCVQECVRGEDRAVLDRLDGPSDVLLDHNRKRELMQKIIPMG